MDEQKHVAGDTATKVCQRCGATFHGNFCAACGAKAEEEITFCPVCGLDREKGAIFCFNCGFSYVQAPTTEVVVAPQSMPVEVKPKKKQSKSVRSFFASLLDRWKALSKKTKVGIYISLAVLVVVGVALGFIFGMDTPKVGTVGEGISYRLNESGEDANGKTLYTLYLFGNGELDLGEKRYPWHGLRKNIEAVVVEDGITAIGKNAFFGCTSLTSVTTANSVTKIGENAFSQCTSLASITIPASVQEIGYCAFYQCTSLAGVTIPTGVTTIGDYAFSQCAGIKTLVFSNTVTHIGYSAFYRCTGLTSVAIPASVTHMGGYAFADCRNLTTISCIGSGAPTTWENTWKADTPATVIWNE